jgi:hypothetical protein
MAISVGIQTILDAKEVLMLVTGASKVPVRGRFHSIILAIGGGAAARGGGGGKPLLAGIITSEPRQCHRGVRCGQTCVVQQQQQSQICMQDATLDMRVRTVNYFQGLHEMNKTAAASERAGVGRRHSGHWVADV